MSLSKGLVGHWRLDEESFNPSTKRFTNLSAYSNHGTGYGTKLGSADPGFVADRMGQLERACPFNGTDDYIDCGNDASLDFTPNTDEFSISMWVKFSADGVSMIAKADATTGNRQYHFYILNNKLDGWIGGVSINTNTTIELDKWYHIVGVNYDDAGTKKFRYYINSIADNTIITSGGTTNAYDTLIGARRNLGNTGSDFEFSGYIDDFRIYNRALSQQEITLLHESYLV